MKHDLNVVLNSRNKVTDSTPLHIATEGGHFDVVKKLLDAGASAADENKAGLTPIHIAAKFGHTELIDKFHKSNVNLRQLSRKTGLTALHIAAYYGNEGNTSALTSALFYFRFQRHWKVWTLYCDTFFETCMRSICRAKKNFKNAKTLQKWLCIASVKC